MIQPNECKNIQEIRAEIDQLDHTIISLVGKRFEYVKAATKFKTSETAVKAPERFAAMLLQRKEWARQQGLDPEVISKIYSDLVNYFIEQELEQWKAQ